MTILKPNKHWIFVGALLAVSSYLRAQSGGYAITGTVRNSATAQPVRNALVALSLLSTPNGPKSYPAGGPLAPQEKVVISGPGGEFHFYGLAEGEYALDARHPEFGQDGTSEHGATVAISGSSSHSSVELKLVPLGVIEGKVADQNGEPIERVLVIVFRLINTPGGERTMRTGTLWTDAGGLFRLTRIEAGKYYVKALGRNGGTETHVGPGVARYAPWESFASVYHDGATDISSAVPVEVTAGSRVRANFNLRLQTAYRIRGELKGYTGSEPVSFELLRGNEDGEPNRALLDGATGRFEILDVVPGSYIVLATQGNSRGEIAVNVGNADAGGISITLSPPIVIHGSIQSIKSETLPPGDEGYVQAHAADCLVSLSERLRPGLGTDASSSDSGNGQFDIEGVHPGKYRVEILCGGGYPESASFGAVDLLANPIISVPPGAAQSPVEIVFKPGGGSLSAKFAGPAPPLGAVLLVPLFSASTGPQLHEVYGMYGLMHPGAVAFPFLAPGDYMVYGLANSDAEFRNPAFLQSLTGGTSVHIEDGKTTEVTIASISK